MSCLGRVKTHLCSRQSSVDPLELGRIKLEFLIALAEVDSIPMNVVGVHSVVVDEIETVILVEVTLVSIRT